MSISLITNIVDRARARMLEQFKTDCAPNLDNLLSIFMQEVQELENQVGLLFEERNVTDAEGAQLDIIGSIVGIDREGRSDTEYRDAIQVQIQVNNTGGQEASIAALLGVLTAATIIDIREVFPAGLDIFINSSELSLNTIQSLRKAVAATVSIQFSQTNALTPFAFAGDSVGDGFGNLVTPTDGGAFAFVLSGI